MELLGNRYEILGTVGSGAAAVVYRVRDRYDGSVKVAKRLHAQNASNEETVRRFEDEFRVLRGLHHPSLPEMFDYGWTDDESRFMVMEFVEGQPLDQYMSENPQDLWVILYQLCEVLTFIHSHNLLHQDVKPGNILVKRTAAFGEEMPLCVLIDFGLTYRRDANERIGMVGTPEYMAPEIIRGEAPLTRAVDYYSLGVTLYQLITGQLPFSGSGRDIFDGHLNQPVHFAREKVEYADLYPHIRGLMAKEKRDRLQAFEEFKRAVIGRMTGGIDELEKAYGLARINSLGMIGKDKVWSELLEWLGWSSSGSSDIGSDSKEPAPSQPVVFLSGAKGSGKSTLLGLLRNEAGIRGEGVFHLLSGSDGKVVGLDGEAAWEGLVTAARTGRALVLVDDVDSLTPPAEDILSYLYRRYSASATDDTCPKLTTVVTSGRVGAEEQQFQSYWSSTVRKDIQILPLTDKDRQQVVSAFRHDTLSASDAEELLLQIGQSSQGSEGVVRTLTGALLSGWMTFGARGWIVKGGRLEVVIDDDHYYGDLVARLPADATALAHVLACSRRTASNSAIAGLLKCSGTQLEDLVQRLEHVGLTKRTGSSMGGTIGYVSSSVKEGVYGSIDGASKSRIHEEYLRVLRNQPDLQDQFAPIEHLADMAFHAAELGRFREALRYQLRAVRAAVKTNDLTTVRASAEAGIVTCDRWARASDDGAPALLRRYLVRTLLRAYQRRSMQAAMHDLMAREYASLPDVPTGFVPAYARALQKMGDRDGVMKLIEERMALLDSTSQPFLHMAVEYALLLRTVSRIDEAIRVLDHVREHASRLTAYYHCRLYIHYLICYDAKGDSAKVAEMASEADRIAISHDFAYERSVVLQAQSNVAFNSHRLDDAMSFIADGVRLTWREGFDNSRKWFYFQASAVYYERGDFARCRRYLGYSLRLSEKSGDVVNVHLCLVRFAMIHHVMGQYGNATKYLDRADGLDPDAVDQDGLNLARLVRFDTALDLNLDTVSDLYTALLPEIEREPRQHLIGYFHFLEGRLFQLRGELDEARSSYLEARNNYKYTGQRDDEARVTLALARVAISLDDDDEYKVLVADLRALVEAVGSASLRAELALLELAAFRGDQEERIERIRHCERVRDDVREAIKGIEADIQLFRAWEDVGRDAESASAFDRFFMNVKIVVAGLPSDETAKGFLARSDISAALTDYSKRRN